MINWKVYDGSALTADDTSDWLETYDEMLKAAKALSVQIAWSDAQGTTDGTLAVQFSNDANQTSKQAYDKETININAASGSVWKTYTDAPRFIRFDYTENNLTSLDLHIYISAAY